MDKKMNKEMNTEGRIEKIKKNIRENRKTYIISGFSFIAGAIGSAVFLTWKYGIKESEIVESCVTRIITSVKGRNNNVTIQTISKYGNRIGRPGTAVVDTTTGRRYESIGLAARDMNRSYNAFYKCLTNETDIDGHKFVRLIEDV